MMEDKLFLYNFSMPNELQIPFRYAKFGSIKDALRHFIIDSISPKVLKFTKCKKFCPRSNSVIFGFLNGTLQNSNTLFSVELRLARLINMYNTNEIDMDSLFREFVFDKILKRNSDKKVYFLNDIIIIESNGKKALAIMTKFYKLDMQKLPCIDAYVKQGFDIIDKIGVDKFYLVFPRNSSFKKHIEIIGKHSLKLIPYTLKHTLCKEKI